MHSNIPLPVNSPQSALWTRARTGVTEIQKGHGMVFAVDAVVI